MAEFKFDRDEIRLNYLRRLMDKGWNNLSDQEKDAWYGEDATSGAYNYTDLNRVESAVAEIAALLGLKLTTKTDWGMWDIPTQSQMNRYLNNVRSIRNAHPSSEYPPLPDSMNNLTLEGANNIEKTLYIAYHEVTGT